MSRREELTAVAHRSRQVALLAALTGTVTGLAVAAFERLADAGFERVLEAPPWAQVVVPGLGLVVAALLVRFTTGGGAPATGEVYVAVFHQRDRAFPLKPVPGRLAASAATLASGIALGFEGPAIYLGSSIGSAVQRRLSRFFSREDAKVLLVAGCAAGVAAVFKAPATGAIFALEVPYRDDLARRMLLPALFSAAAGYVAFALVNGTTPLFDVGGSPPFDVRDLAGAAVLGLLCGGGARLYAKGVEAAEHLGNRGPAWLRIGLCAVAAGALVALSIVVADRPLALGPGYQTIAWALEPGRTIPTLVLIALIRAGATGVGLVGRGVGGLFVQLVLQGALLGRIVGDLAGVRDTTLFPLLGVAAFLGAGYRVPLAAVMFVAESTGRPGFVVPGLVAAAAGQLLVGTRSVSPNQRASRLGHVELRVTLPVTAALRTDASTVPPDATVAELVDQRVRGDRARVLPVVDGARYLGMVHAHDLFDLDRRGWATTTVAEVMRTDAPTAARRLDPRRRARRPRAVRRGPPRRPRRRRRLRRHGQHR